MPILSMASLGPGQDPAISLDASNQLVLALVEN
jgi:hypothetical protein